MPDQQTTPLPLDADGEVQGAEQVLAPQQTPMEDASGKPDAPEDENFAMNGE